MSTALAGIFKSWAHEELLTRVPKHGPLCGFGFLSVWQPKSSQTSPKAAQGSKGKCFNEQGGSHMASCGLVSEVT